MTKAVHDSGGVAKLHSHFQFAAADYQFPFQAVAGARLQPVNTNQLPQNPGV
jgi:hypothetical protein